MVVGHMTTEINEGYDRRISRVEERVSVLERSHDVVGEKINNMKLTMDMLSNDIKQSHGAIANSLEKHQIAMDAKVNKINDSLIAKDKEKNGFFGKILYGAIMVIVVMIVTAIANVTGLSNLGKTAPNNGPQIQIQQQQPIQQAPAPTSKP
jgi:hypothetical protein